MELFEMFNMIVNYINKLALKNINITSKHQVFTYLKWLIDIFILFIIGDHKITQQELICNENKKLIQTYLSFRVKYLGGGVRY